MNYVKQITSYPAATAFIRLYKNIFHYGNCLDVIWKLMADGGIREGRHHLVVGRRRGDGGGGWGEREVGRGRRGLTMEKCNLGGIPDISRGENSAK